MTAITKTCVSVGIFGDDLDPSWVSAVLGAGPTDSRRRGEPRIGSAGRAYPAPTGSWHLRAAERSPGDLNTQIVEVLSRLTNDLSGWQELVARYRCRVFCGLFLHETNQMAAIQPSTLRLIADRGIELVFDIYGMGDSAGSDQTPPEA